MSTIKVAALLAGHVSVDSTWTALDFAALSLAAADQAGVSAKDQAAIAEILPILFTWSASPLGCDMLVTIEHATGVSVFRAAGEIDGEHYVLVSGPPLDPEFLDELRHDRGLVDGGFKPQYRKAA